VRSPRASEPRIHSRTEFTGASAVLRTQNRLGNLRLQTALRTVSLLRF
jgi:hypothetical protein